MGLHLLPVFAYHVDYEAIEQLEDYIASATVQNSDYYQAKMWLVKAYQGAEQMNRALALCHELRETGSDIAKIWADRYITNLAPEPEEALGIAQPDLPEPPATVLPQKNVVDFKAFCQEHLVKDLKEIEAMRQMVQKSIAWHLRRTGRCFVWRRIIFRGRSAVRIWWFPRLMWEWRRLRDWGCLI